MVAPKGNQYAKGNKGGGRKSAYEERQLADVLQDAWENGFDEDAAKKRLKNKKNIRILDRYLVKSGESERILCDMSKKIFPDKTNVSGNVNLGMTLKDWTQAANAELRVYEEFLKTKKKEPKKLKTPKKKMSTKKKKPLTKKKKSKQKNKYIKK